jgi:hypothetical protein
MGQVLTTGKPGLPATYHGDLNVFSLCSDRMHTADAMERGWGAGRSPYRRRHWTMRQ